MSEGLKPCPFCGGEPKYVSNTDDTQGREWHEIYCGKCGNGTISSIDSVEIFDKWNTRATIK